MRPGPFWAISLPSRKTTARSYSRRMRIPDMSRIATKTMNTTTMAMTTPTPELLSGSICRGSCFPMILAIGRLDRADPKRQPLHGLDAHSTAAFHYPAIPHAVAGQHGSPQGPLDEDLSGRVEALADLADRPDHLFPAGTDRLAPRPNRPLDGDSEKTAQQEPGDHHHRGGDLEGARVCVVEEQPRGNERRYPGGAEDAVGGQVRLGDDHRQPEYEQQNARHRHRELRGPVEAEQEREGAERPGRDRPGAEQLDREPQQSGEQQQVGDGGIDEDLEQVVLEGHVVPLDRQARGVEDLGLRPLDSKTVQSPEQRLLGGGDEVDEPGV